MKDKGLSLAIMKDFQQVAHPYFQHCCPLFLFLLLRLLNLKLKHITHLFYLVVVTGFRKQTSPSY